MNYTPIRLQAAFFLTNIDFSSKLDIATEIRSRAKNLLDVDPVLLPLPQDAPSEFPHIIMKNDKNGWAFQIAPARFDLVLDSSAQKTPPSLDEVSEKLYTLAVNIWKGLEYRFGAHANRLASVIAVASQVDNAPEMVRQRYLNLRYGVGAFQNQVHILHKAETEGFHLNRWIRLISLPEEKDLPSRLLMEVDINTLAERPFVVTDANANSFFQLANRQTKEAHSFYLAE